MKITVLTGLEKPDPKSYDVVADQVAAALAKKGHKTNVLGVYDVFGGSPDAALRNAAIVSRAITFPPIAA